MEEKNVAQNPPQVQQPVQGQTQSPISVSKSKLPFMLITIFALLVILGSGAYYYIKNSNLKNQISNPQLKSQNLTPTQAIDETANPDLIGADWKTYTNKKYGYSIKSPTNWIVVGGDNGNVYKASDYRGFDPSQMNLILPSKSCSITYKMKPYDCGVKNEIVIVVRDNTKNLPLKEFGKNYIGPGFEDKYTPITIDKINGLSNKYGDSSTFVFFENKSKIYIINNDQPDKIFDQILSTFRFGELTASKSPDQNQTIDTSNWKTYTNSAWGISFKYPADWKADIVKNRRIELTPKDSRAIFINYWDNPKGLNILDFLKNFDEDTRSKEAMITGIFVQSPSLYSRNLKEITLSNGTKAYYESKFRCDPYSCDRYLFASKNKIFNFQVFTERQDLPSDLPRITNQILSTFRFGELTASKFPDQNQQEPTSAEINGFPIFPGATFVKKEITAPCTGKESGFSYCGSTTYIWTSNKADKVNDWYTKDQSNSGWQMSGGAGSFDDSQNYSGKITLKKGSLVYDLNWDAQNNKVTFTLAIPNK